jgi:polysaccharide chain length determinant protein (PEP-CTERM system associated)
MSVPFRQRTPGEYLAIIWKRKWVILLPAIAIAAAVALVVMRLPNVYESSTLIVVKPSTISEAIVPTMSEDMLTRQLTSISQMVTSRSSLQPLIEKYDLYAQDRGRGDSMESIVEQMRKDIKVELNTTRNDITNGFNLSYRGREPRTTQAVTAELASKYVNAQTDESQKSNTSTKAFFTEQIAKVKEELDEIAKRRLDFMTQNLSHLPDSNQVLGTQLTGLFEQQKSYVAEIGRMRGQQNILSQSLGDLEKQRQQEIDNIINDGNDPKRLPEYTQLQARLDALDAEKRNMLTTLKPANPDVKKKQQEIDDVRAKMDAAIEEGKAQAEEKRKRYESQTDPRINQVKYSLEAIKGDIDREQKQLDDTNEQIAAVRTSLNAIPGVQVGLEAIDREYNTKQEAYNNLLKQQQSAGIISDIGASQQGKSIAVIDAANLPESPVAPKRAQLMILGLILGLGAGFALAALIEVPSLLTVQTTSDAEHYTGLPVLVSVPELLTGQEERKLSRRRLLFAAAGVVATVLSIPVIAYGIKFTHILDRFVS